MSRLRDESGIGLVEILASLTIFSIVLAATLTVLEDVQRQTGDARVRFDSRDEVRTAVDRVVKPLRAVVQTSTGMVETAGANDLVYQSVGPTAPTGTNTTALERVRICLDPTVGKVWRYAQSFPDGAPAVPAQACDGNRGSYSSVGLIAANVSNGASRPMFTYDYRGGSTALSDLQGIKVSLSVDANGPNRLPPEADLTTAIALRNINKAPLAAFTYAIVNGHVLADATSSIDPEGGSLKYAWSIDGGATAGSDVRWDKPGLLNNSTHTVTLTVTDPADVTDTLSQTITMPS